MVSLESPADFGHADWRSGQIVAPSSCSATDRTGDDLSRNVFGVLGIPIDALDLKTLLRLIDCAVQLRKPFLLSTPNVNFLMISRADDDFRESLLMSDLCPVDGMPMVWVARLLGLPVQDRLSGSDIFEALRSRRVGEKLKVFLFGGAEGIADEMCQSLNAAPEGLSCVGALNPGFGSVSDMSRDDVVQMVNASQADLLAMFLSARKAQAWLLQNHDRVDVPVRAQFGATINLQVGLIRRAPSIVQRMGFEWLWRVKEEPYLWRRYWSDGWRLLRLVLTCVLPLAAARIWKQVTGVGQRETLTIDRGETAEVVAIKLRGAAVHRHIDAATTCFRQVLVARKPTVIDVSHLSAIDPRFFGLLLMLRKQLLSQGHSLTFSGVTGRTSRIFQINGFGFLLEPSSRITATPSR